MKFNQVAGTALVPLLSRIVLALAFTTVGFNKLFTPTEMVVPADSVVASFAMQDAPAEDAAPADDEATETDAAAGPAFERVAFVQEAPAEVGAAVDAAADQAADIVDQAADGTDQAVADVTGAEPAATAGDITVRVRSLHRITRMCEEAGLPQAKWLGWVAAVSEFLGGMFVLVGILTRFWSMGLAIAMGVAFYLTTMPTGVLEMMPQEYATNIPNYNRAMLQIALFAAAIGLVFTGPGPFSFDRLIFASDGVKDAAAGAPEPAPRRAAAATPAMQPAPAPAPAPAAYPAGIQPPPGVASPVPAPADGWSNPQAAPPVAPATPSMPVAAPVPADIPLDADPAAAPNPEAPAAGPDAAGPRPGTSTGGEGRPL